MVKQEGPWAVLVANMCTCRQQLWRHVGDCAVSASADGLSAENAAEPEVSNLQCRRIIGWTLYSGHRAWLA